MTQVVLSIEDIYKTYRVGFFRRKVPAVQGVSLDIRPGEIFGLVGPNGAGKSTTIKMITGLVRPDAGQIRLFGQDIARPEVRRRLGFLPENPNLYPHLKADELMIFFGGLLGMTVSEARTRGRELLDLVGLSHALDRPISKFSKGMKQRAGIAQALLGDPDFIILDEPQSGLDPMGRREVRDLIVDLRRQGKTILFCSHILSDVEEICDRVALIHKGRLRATGFLHELLDSKVQRYELFLKGWSDTICDQLGDALEESFPLGDITRIILKGSIELEATLALLQGAGAKIERLEPHRQRLEDIFLSTSQNPK